MDDGQRLRLHRWLPPTPARGVLLVVHGIAEHGGRYAPLAEFLSARGYAVYAYDQRGHGETASGPAELGVVTGGWTRLLSDLHILGEHLSRQHPGLPRLLFGHSMGSLLVQDAIIERGGDWAGAILQASNHRPDPLPRLGEALARGLVAVFGHRHRSRLLDFVTIGVLRFRLVDRRTRYDWLNRDRREVDSYIADPRCGFSPTALLWAEVYRGTRRVADPRRRARVPAGLPVLLLVGGDDGLSAGGARLHRLAEAYRRAGLKEVSLRIYPGARHELHRELNREEVFADLADWLDARCPAPIEEDA